MNNRLLTILFIMIFSIGFYAPAAFSQEQTSKTRKEIPELTTSAVCSGKYKKSGSLGFEIINVRCPKLTDTCVCEIDKKYNNQVKCGAALKKPSFESNLVDCETIFVLESR